LGDNSSFFQFTGWYSVSSVSSFFVFSTNVVSLSTLFTRSPISMSWVFDWLENIKTDFKRV
jgi:hypothetical protein